MIGTIFSGALSKALLISTLILAATTALSTHLYLGTRDEVASLKTQQEWLEQGLKDCSDAKDKVLESAKQDDKIVAATQKNIQTISAEKDKLLRQLNNIPGKSCRPLPENKNEIQYVDIYAPFSDEFISVVQQSNSGEAGSADTPAR